MLCSFLASKQENKREQRTEEMDLDKVDLPILQYCFFSFVPENKILNCIKNTNFYNKMYQMTFDSAPMLLGTVEQLPTDWWATEKIDGIRAIWTGTKFITRTLRDYPAVPDYILQEMPANFPLDGEFFVDYGKFDLISGAASKKRSSDWPPHVKFMVFDYPCHEPLTYDERYDLLKIKLADHFSGTKPTVLHLLNRKKIPPEKFKTALQAIWDKGGEGLVLRNPLGLYRSGKRSKDALKVKNIFEEEATVLNYSKPPAHKNWQGGALLVKDVKSGIEFKVGSGLNNFQRENLFAEFPRGSIITYTYMEKTKNNKPRHPVVKGIRHDFENVGSDSRTDKDKLISQFRNLIINTTADKPPGWQFKIKNYKNTLKKLAAASEDVVLDANEFTESELNKFKTILSGENITPETSELPDDIFGVGPAMLSKFKTFEDLKKSDLPKSTKLSLKYYDKTLKKIPRSLISEVSAAVPEEVIVGSYRRQAPESGDVDILTLDKSRLLRKLKKIYKIVKFTEGPVGFMGLIYFPSVDKWGRLDITETTATTWPFALLRKTGNKDFNIRMSIQARALGYKLSEKSLSGYTGRVESEEDVFKALEIPFVEPHLRL